jgi:hypothetical protein
VKIHVGFDLTYESAHSTPMIFMLNVHPSRAHDLITPDRLRITPSRAISPYIDGFGNKCVRILAPPGQLRVACDTIVADSGKPDRVDRAACSLPSPLAGGRGRRVHSYFVKSNVGRRKGNRILKCAPLLLTGLALLSFLPCSTA